MEKPRIWAILLLLTACEHKEPDFVQPDTKQSPPDQHCPAGRDLEPFSLYLGPQYLVQTFAAPIGFRHAEVEAQMKYGSFLLTEHDETPWQNALNLTNEEYCPEVSEPETYFAATLADESSRTLGTLRIVPKPFRSVEITVKSMDPQMNRTRFAWKCQPGEKFMGLGGQSWDVNHRGQRVPLWVSEDGISKQDHDGDNPSWFLIGDRHSTHSPMPIFYSSRGYAVVLDTPARAIVDLCATDSQRVEVENWQGEMKLRFFFSDYLQNNIAQVTQTVGRPPVPPLFAFTPWLDAIGGQENVLRVAKKLRENHIPVGAIWTEDWRGGTRAGDDYTLDEDWNSDDKQYPDLKKLTTELHALGFKFLTYNNTFLTQDADIYDEALKSGFSIHKPDGSPYTYETAKFVPGSMLDLSNPAAVKWAQGVYQKGLDQGADGWMADFCEWLPTDIQLFSKEDPWLVHNRYAVDCQKLNKELMEQQKDNVDRLFFVRSAWLGSQPLVSVIWAGDQQTDFSAGDGLKSVIPMGIGLGVTGFPYFGSDIGGYMSTLAESPTSKELWFRWVELGAFSPIMRTHHGKSAYANWNWESDDESVQHLKKYANLHMKLLPYLLNAAKQAHEKGMPILRPLALNWPDFLPGWSMTDEFALGDSIVVAPVVEKEATSRAVLLPKGEWYPLLGGPRVMSDGALPLQVAATLTDLPAFVPAGTMLVLLPDNVDTSNAVTPTSGLSMPTADREIWLWPGDVNRGYTKDPLTDAEYLVFKPWTTLPALSWHGKFVIPQRVDGLLTLDLQVAEGTENLMAGANLSEPMLTVTGLPAGTHLRVRFPSL